MRVQISQVLCTTILCRRVIIARRIQVQLYYFFTSLFVLWFYCCVILYGFYLSARSWIREAIDNLVYLHLKQNGYHYALSLFEQESCVETYSVCKHFI